MSARVAQIPPNPWDTHIDCMAECLDCGIEWGWGASYDKLCGWIAEHNAHFHHAAVGENPKGNQ